MLNEKIRLLYFSKGTGLRQFSLTPKQFYTYFAVGGFTLLLVLSISIHLVTGLFHDVRIDSLKRNRNDLQKQMISMKEQIALLNAHMTEVENTGDMLRNAVGLPAIDKDVRQVGVGGSYSSEIPEYPYFNDEVNRTAAEDKKDMDKILREMQLERASLQEVHQLVSEQHSRAEQMPSINPILGAHVVQNFGLRMDPFLDKIASHEGVDIPMPQGTKVLATAAGVIKVAKTIYTPYKSYGMEVVVDHGFGFETRYAHLSKILVSPGQRVKRWQPIGEVGETGRATGPHLHYEVMRSGRPENPMNHMLVEPMM
jgi:murein DD-endopeptidase MepM/ murein hydrolase activator NlpD